MINFLLENKDLTAEQELQCLICIGIDVIKEQFTFIKNWNEVTAFTFKHPNFNYVNKLSITKITPDLITLNFNEKSARSLILSGVMLNKIVEIIKPCIESKYQEQLMRASLQSNKEKLEQEKIKVNALVKEAEKEIVLKKLFHEIKVALKVFYGNKCFFCNIKLPEDFQHMTLDHLLPRSKGGKDELSNLVLCCQPCNAKKSSISLINFIDNDKALLNKVVNSLHIHTSLKEEAQLVLDVMNKTSVIPLQIVKHEKSPCLIRKNSCWSLIVAELTFRIEKRNLSHNCKQFMCNKSTYLLTELPINIQQELLTNVTVSELTAKEKQTLLELKKKCTLKS